MSADTLAVPDLTLKVQCSRKGQENREEEEEMEVEILMDEEHHADLGSQQARPQTHKNSAAGNRKTSKVTALTLGVMYLLILAGIYVRYHSVSLENEQLKTGHDKLSNNYTQLQETASEIEVKIHQLQNSNETLSKDLRQLQDEVKQLQGKIGKWCPEGWKRLGCSCYFRSSEKKRWSDSRSDCQSKGADLVVINNKEEHEFVRQLSDNEESWIGLQPDTGKWVGASHGYEWKWVDGAPLTFMFFPSGLSRTTQLYQYAACCNRNGQWTQGGYDYPKYWICEKEMICLLS